MATPRLPSRESCFEVGFGKVFLNHSLCSSGPMAGTTFLVGGCNCLLLLSFPPNLTTFLRRQSNVGNRGQPGLSIRFVGIQKVFFFFFLFV